MSIYLKYNIDIDNIKRSDRLRVWDFLTTKSLRIQRNDLMPLMISLSFYSDHKEIECKNPKIQSCKIFKCTTCQTFYAKWKFDKETKTYRVCHISLNHTHDGNCTNTRSIPNRYTKLLIQNFPFFMDIERTTLKSQMIPFKELCHKLNIEINHLNVSNVSKSLREINFKEIFENMPEQAKLDIGLKVNICTLCKVNGKHNRRTCPNRTSHCLSTSTIQEDYSSEISPSNNKKTKSLVKTTKLEVKKMKFSDTNSDTISIQKSVDDNDCVVLERSTHPTSGHDIVPRVSFTLRGTFGFKKSLTSEDKLRITNKHVERGNIHDTLVTFGTEVVSRRSFLTLRPRYWLTDEVVNMFLFLLSKREEQTCVRQGEKKRSHFFSSFFFTQLLDEHVSLKYTYKNVQRWSKVRFQFYFTTCFDILF